MSEPKIALGYIRVSTDQQGERGYGLDAQTEKIREEATRRGWDLQHIYVDVASGRSTRRRASPHPGACRTRGTTNLHQADPAANNRK